MRRVSDTLLQSFEVLHSESSSHYFFHYRIQKISIQFLRFFFCAKIQLKVVQNLDASCMIRIMHDTFTLFVSILIRIIFNTTQLFDVTFLLRNIIVTLEAKQKPPWKKFSKVVSLLNSIKLLVLQLPFCFRIS